MMAAGLLLGAALGGNANYHDSGGNIYQIPTGNLPNPAEHAYGCPSLSYSALVGSNPPPASDCNTLAPGSR